MTADIVPAIPTSTKRLSGRSIRANSFRMLAVRKPVIPPRNRVGANIPPTPPAPVVELLATTFRRIRHRKKSINTRYPLPRLEKREF